MIWKDAAEPTKGVWYTGQVVQEGEEWAPKPGAVWEGVSVMWEADGSKTPSCSCASIQHNVVHFDVLLPVT